MPAQVKRNDVPPVPRQKRHHISPRVPALWPARQQEKRRTFPAIHEVQTNALDRRCLSAELRPERRWVECRKRISGGSSDDLVIDDEHSYCIDLHAPSRQQPPNI